MYWFELEENILLELTVTSDETWVHYFTPESKQSNMEWYSKHSPTPNKFRTHVSAGKVMVSLFWDSEGVITLIFFHTVL
jgi:hypothetical protein